jgi:hypothetical protein
MSLLRTVRLALFASIFVFLLGLPVRAQVNPTGTLTGTVLDPSGAAVAGASIEATDASTSTTLTAKSGADGHFNIANVPPGTYKVTVSMANFQTAVYNAVVVEVGKTYDLKASLQVGQVSQQVTVEAGQEVLETTQSSIGTTFTGSVITHEPSPSNSALNGLVLLSPDIQTIGGPRQSSADGLPGGAVNITFDGISAQWQSGKSGDPIFTMVNANVDDVAEFNISSAAASASQSGQGAVQITMVSQSGTNNFHGGLWEYFRNDYLNANYYFNNEAGLPRQKMRYDQWGAKIGGPILKNRLFFFADFSQWIRPQGVSRIRTILNPQATAGVYTYTPVNSAGAVSMPTSTPPWVTCTASTQTCQANLFQMASNFGATSSEDSLIHSALTAIQGSTSQPGVGLLAPPSLYQQNLDFTNTGPYTLDMPDVRLDYNITKNHSFEADYHLTRFNLNPDILNGEDFTFPVAPFNTNDAGYIADRMIYAFAWRWNIGSNKSNELRFGFQTSPEWFATSLNTGIYPQVNTNLGTGIRIQPVLPTPEGTTLMTDPWLQDTPSADNNAVGQLIDNFAWTRGTHSLAFGFTLTREMYKDVNLSPEFATVNLGLASTDPFINQFNSANLPNMGASDLAISEQLYGMLAGKVTSYLGSVALDPSTRQFVTGAPQQDKYHQSELGIYATDSWRMRPNFTLNYGLRWEYEGVPVDDLNEYFTLNGGVNGLYGVSGPGNLFKPGTMTGSTPEYVLDNGAPWYNNWDKGFAPSLGFAWQPDFKNSMLSKMVGTNGTVIRAGYSISYSQEGLQNWIGPSNPGFTGAQFANPVAPGTTLSPGQFNAGSVLLQSLTVPNVAQNPATFSTSFPINPAEGQNVYAENPNLHMPYVQSWSAGIQRQLTSNMVIEVRYVGNHGVGLWDTRNLDEVNVFENGFLAESQNALNNLSICQANATACLSAQAADGIGVSNQTSANFADFGLAGQRPLPILTASFTGTNNSAPGAMTQANPNFSSGQFVSNLQTGQIGSMASTLSGFSFWQNLLAAGYPKNFWMVNPDAGAAGGGAYLVTNDLQSTYNAMVVDVRQRPAHGLTFDFNYTFAKALTDDWQRNGNNTLEDPISLRYPNSLMKGPSPYDVRNAGKFSSTYELPFGPGHRLTSNNSFVTHLIGGWFINSVIRAQSGRPMLLVGGLGGTINQYDGGVELLNGLTTSSLQSQLGVYKTTGAVWDVPQTLLGPGGNGTNPQFLQACGTPGAYCNRVFIYGPAFFDADIALQKTTKITERVSLELRVEALDAFNNANFLFGDAYGISGYSAGASFFSTVTGNLQNPAFGRIFTAYQDLDSTDEPGGRLLQLVARLNF